MYVLATAGHVDHGKSTLVRALTGTDPDRLPEERRRGLSIELGFAWTDLPSGERVAFVDVPGHQRFVPTMLAGVGAVPAVLLVVAADGGWCAQTAEHVAVLDALGIARGVVAISRSDLADPGPALADVTRRLARTSLAGIPSVVVSGRTGAGLAALRTALDDVLAAAPAPEKSWRTRLFIDRAFTARGSGTVVTGTLAAGELRVGDQLRITDRDVVVRALESCAEQHEQVLAPARVAVNIRGVARDELHRGDALVTPGGWWPTTTVDVSLRTPAERLPARMTLHVGSAAIAVQTRLLAGSDGRFARFRNQRPLPLQPGDRGVLRDPGRGAPLVGVVVADVAPPPLERRGAARVRSAALAQGYGLREVLAQGGVARRDLEQQGWLRPTDPLPRDVSDVDGLLLDAAHAPPAAMAEPLDPGLLTAHDLLRRRLLNQPFRSPDATELAALGVAVGGWVALARAGLVLRLPGEILLLPDAPDEAVCRLRGLEQPFTVGEAARALDTTRRVAIPLLEHLDHLRRTRRSPDGLRTVR